MQGITDIDGLYHLDLAHCAIGFTVKHAGLSRVRGTFDSFHGYAIIDRDNVENSALMVSVASASINTKWDDRDTHLRSADFFDVANYPAMTYVATGFRILDDERVLVLGDLTIKDVTRPLDLEFVYTGGATDPFGNERIGFEAEARISRKDFGLTWNAALETGGWLVGDEIRIEVEASAVKQADPNAPADLSQIAAPGEADTVVLHGEAEVNGGAVPEPIVVPRTLAQPEPALVGAGAGARRAAADNDFVVGVHAGSPKRALADPDEVAPVADTKPWWHRILH